MADKLVLESKELKDKIEAIEYNLQNIRLSLLGSDYKPYIEELYKILPNSKFIKT